MSAPAMLATALVLWNLAVFLLYATDKWRAKTKRRRIPEATLLGCAFAMGGLGALLGMVVPRHKTRHKVFCVLVPLALALQLGLLVWLWGRYL